MVKKVTNPLGDVAEINTGEPEQPSKSAEWSVPKFAAGSVPGETFGTAVGLNLIVQLALTELAATDVPAGIGNNG